MSINDLKNKNELADLHSDWEDKKAKFEYALTNYQVSSEALRTHSDYSSEATEDENTEVVEYDAKVEKVNAKEGANTPK